MKYHVENSLLLTFFGLFLWLSLLNWFGLIILENQFSPAEGWTCWLGQVGIIDNRRVIQSEHWYLENRIFQNHVWDPEGPSFASPFASLSFKFHSQAWAFTSSQPRFVSYLWLSRATFFLCSNSFTSTEAVWFLEIVFLPLLSKDSTY